MLRAGALDMPMQKWKKQDHLLTAHQWLQLLDHPNRWSVYPNTPNKMFTFANWNPQWADNLGKLTLKY